MDFLKKSIFLNFNYSKYKFKYLLTKDPNETSSVEYIIITNKTALDFSNLMLTFVFTFENLLKFTKHLFFLFILKSYCKNT